MVCVFRVRKTLLTVEVRHFVLFDSAFSGMALASYVDVLLPRHAIFPRWGGKIA